MSNESGSLLLRYLTLHDTAPAAESFGVTSEPAAKQQRGRPA